VGVGPDHDLAGLGHGLEPAGGVDDVAHGGGVAAGPQRAHEHLAGVDADSHLEAVGADLVGPRRQRPLHAQAGADRPLGVVLVGDRRAEERQQPVADHLVDATAEVGDVGGQPFEASVDEVLDLLGVPVLGQGREADEIGEQHGEDPPLVASLDEGLAAAGTEAGFGRGQGAACTAARHRGHVRIVPRLTRRTGVRSARMWCRTSHAPM
jgi:hypothetical protein